MAEDGKKPGDDPSGGLSHDPRTWGARPWPEPKAPADSFDPKTWSRPSGAPADRPAPPSRRGLMLGLTAVGGVVGVGALAAGVMHLARRQDAVQQTAQNTATPAGPSDDTYVAPPVEGYEGLRQRLVNYGVADAEAVAAVAALRKVAGRDPGRMHLEITLRAGAEDKPRLIAADLRRASDGMGLQLRRDGEAFTATALAARLTRTLVAHPRGQINRDGLYASAIDSVSPDLMTQFATALAFDFDIAEEVREGDQFEIVHEEWRDDDGNVVGAPRLVFAFLSADGKDRYLYRLKPRHGEEDWFDDRGQSTHRTFMRTPLNGARITSLFGPRVHPVLHIVREHKGTDFGCPIGTQVYAAADGEVTYAGPASGFGVLLKIAHESGLETWYGHLSAFPDGITQGARVVQGQVVALSGNIGVSSGPHLHYEVHKDGVAVDPKNYLDVQGGATSGGQALSGPDRVAFLARKDEIDLQRRSQA